MPSELSTWSYIETIKQDKNHNIKLGKYSFEKVEQFEYLRTTPKILNSIHEEIIGSLKSGYACYHSVQNLLSCSLLPNNAKIRIYRNVILLVVYYGCENWSLTLREKRRLKLFENRVLIRIFGPEERDYRTVVKTT